MINKTISIPEDISNRLKNEENASALITRLLLDYYKYNIDDITTIEQRLEDINKTKQEHLEKLEQESFILIKKKNIIKSKQEEEDRKKNEELNKQGAMVASILKTFKEKMGRDMTDLELETYNTRRIVEERGFNLFQFMDEITQKEDGQTNIPKE